MISFRIFQVSGLAALAAGLVIAFCVRRLPVRGWVGVLLLLSASISFVLIDSEGPPNLAHLAMLLIFLFIAPIAVVYAFRVRRRAPDRVVATAAFVGSFLVAPLWLFFAASFIASLFAPRN
jgi:hypothetical protein